jgi:hypothetical protein
MDQVPEATRGMFTDGDYEKADRLAELKRRLKRSGCEVYEGYPASWLRLEEGEDGRPLLGGLDRLAQRVFQNLFNAIVEQEYEEASEEVLANEAVEWERINAAFVRASADLFR